MKQCALGRTRFLKPLNQRPLHMPAGPWLALASGAIRPFCARLANWGGVALTVGVVDCLATGLWGGSANQRRLAFWAIGLIGSILPACWYYGCAFFEGPHERGFRDSGGSSSDADTDEEAIAGSSYRSTSH